MNALNVIVLVTLTMFVCGVIAGTTVLAEKSGATSSPSNAGRRRPYAFLNAGLLHTSSE